MVVLLVDDRELALEVEKMLLENNGVTVEMASGGKHAIELAKTNKYALIFMTIPMEGMDGYATARAIREFDPEVPILALSPEKEDQTSEKFKESGMTDFLTRPICVKDLREKLAKYLHIVRRDICQWRRERDMLFDYEALTKMVDDEKAIQTILYSFLSAHKNDCIKIQEQIAKRNYRQACAILRDIIGISGNIFCHRLFETATLLNIGLKKGRTEKLPVFVNVWEDTISELSVHCDDLICSHPPTMPKYGNWPELFTDFLAHVDDFDVEATEIFNLNTALFEEYLPEDIFKQIQHHISRYEYLDVQRLMRKVRDV